MRQDLPRKRKSPTYILYETHLCGPGPMILYQLQCKNEHEFEGWFGSSAAYDEQRAARKVACPVCNSRAISKAIMAPNVATKGAIKTHKGRQDKAEDIRKVRTQYVKAVKKAREHVEQNFDYVGDKFSDEARRIHYGESDDRNIYGEATPEEARDLMEEGIDVAPLPEDPEKAN